MDDLKELAESLTELGRTMRRLALQLGLFVARVSSLQSDTRVLAIPRHLVRFQRQDVSES
jgi:hypothetical protein